MTNKIHFHKMHGSGNDYIYVNTMKYTIVNPEEKAKRWSEYHTGIGADGLVLIGKSDKADFSMRIFNADGSEAMMCGNAARCVGKYVYEHGHTTKTVLKLDTLSGIKILNLHVDNNRVKTVTVDMGIPEADDKLTTVKAGNNTYEGTVVSMGNPHFVIIIDDINKVDLETAGPLIENNPLFPDRTNVEFAEIKDKSNVRMRVWERGSGITMACGTGACATLAACASKGKTNHEADIIMDGGMLSVLWDENGHIQMTGEAVGVFEGDIDGQDIPGQGGITDDNP
ncbi:MAG: diaminopimelate epimerase [Tannerella sp.]|jgi:diaminopimelate epimerase|nr:diaminopimelate epimerase [Tannerella sp.]